MTPKQFERKIEDVEKMLSDLQGRLLARIFRYATDEELDALLRLRDAVKGAQIGTASR